MKWCTRGVVKKFLACLQFELQPVINVIPNAKAPIQQQAFASDIEEMESCFDDLRNAQALAKAYLKHKDDDDVKEFFSEVKKLQRKFKEAIKRMNSENGPGEIEECIKAYTEALGGLDIEGKFTCQWKKILKTKVSKMIMNSTNDDSDDDDYDDDDYDDDNDDDHD